MKVTIETIDNGYIVKWEDDVEHTYAFTEQDAYNRQTDEHRAIEDMLYCVMEAIGFYNSKHNKYFLQVENVKK